MKLTIIFLLSLLAGHLNASDKDQTLVIAKGIQCSYLREKSFLDINELYSLEKLNSEYVKKISDSIYSQAFKICDPENTVNADKEILTSCSTSCDQFATKGVLGLGGVSSSDVEKCKKLCLNYSDILSHKYTSSAKAIKKYIELNPPCVKKTESIEPQPSPSPAISPAPLVQKEKEKEKKEDEKSE